MARSSPGVIWARCSGTLLDKQEIGEWQTIRVTESSDNSQASGEERPLALDHVLNPQGAGAQLKSLAAYTPAEPSSNLLDDLHNQINPLI